MNQSNDFSLESLIEIEIERNTMYKSTLTLIKHKCKESVLLKVFHNQNLFQTPWALLQLDGEGDVQHGHNAQGVQSECWGPDQAPHPLPLLPRRPLPSLQSLRGQRLHWGGNLRLCKTFLLPLHRFPIIKLQMIKRQIWSWYSVENGNYVRFYQYLWGINIRWDNGKDRHTFIWML